VAATFAPEKDYYAVLGVEPTASASQINAAYRARVRVTHPERFDWRSQPEEWETANEILRDLNAAYSILGEPQSRAEYDEQ
jgi:curved DNA-binding protein CbpA